MQYFTKKAPHDSIDTFRECYNVFLQKGLRQFFKWKYIFDLCGEFEKAIYFNFGKKSKLSDDKISRTILLSTWDNLWDIVYKSNAVYDHFDIFSAW